jgi:hypothetical protein
VPILRLAGKASIRCRPVNSALGVTKQMTSLPAYDPEIQPSAEAWLELDEQERIALAESYHRREKIELPNAKAHAVLHAIVENQVALGLECVVRAVPRLVKQGLSRHDAVHAIASVLADHLHEQANSKMEDPTEVVQARYNSAVERLTANEWLAKYGSR